ncbi:MAG: hypothetical protein PHY72_02975 [Candidatus Pacebacteria bacterium]|nr:hypothetical protein [Candidatus Paceibacterota bacterium]
MNKQITANVLAVAALVLSVFGLVFFSFPASADVVSMYTHPSADITSNSAVVSGELSNLGGKTSATIWFDYGLTSNYGSKTNSQVMTTIGTFQATLSNLNSCSLYHYRAVGDNGSGAVYGVDRTFSTLCSNDELRVSLEAIPYSGPAPLNNVDLKADVSGRLAGDLRYWFDCNNDGSWDKQLTMYQGPSSSYTADSLCNYSTAGTYTAKVRVEKLGLSAEGTTIITVGGGGVIPSNNQYTLNVQKTVQDITNGTVFGDSIAANFGDEMIYKVVITSSGSVTAPAVYIKDAMPSGLIYLGNLTIDGISDGRSVLDGILLGDMPVGTSRTITYRARVNTKEFFNYGTNSLINSALVYNNGVSISDTATVVVVKRAVAGAATDVNTGIVSDLFGSLLLPLVLAALLLFIFKSQLLGFDKWATVRKEETNGFRAQKKLNSLIKKRK